MINLLPEQYKTVLRQKERFRLTMVLGSLGLAFLVCLSLLFLSIRIYVAGVLQSHDILIGMQQQEYEEESPADQIRAINQDITQLSDFYRQQVRASDIVAKVAAALPESAHLTSLTYNAAARQSAGKISLAGFAPTAEDLLQFRAALEANSAFSNFFFPPSNWVDAQDIDFSFTFEVTPLDS